MKITEAVHRMSEILKDLDELATVVESDDGGYLVRPDADYHLIHIRIRNIFRETGADDYAEEHQRMYDARKGNIGGTLNVFRPLIVSLMEEAKQGKLTKLVDDRFLWRYRCATTVSFLWSKILWIAGGLATLVALLKYYKELLDVLKTLAK